MGLPAEVFDHSTVGWEAAWRRFVRVERGARGVRAYPGAPSVEGISPGVPPPAPPGWRFLYGGKRATLGEASGHGVWSRAAPGLPLVRFPLSPEGQGMAAAVFDEAESFGPGADGSLPIVRAISGLTLLGGFGFPTLTGHRYRIFFGPRGMRFVASWDTTIAWTPYEDVLGIHIGGPGLVTTGAHVFGGGFGVKGAVEGMAMRLSRSP